MNIIGLEKSSLFERQKTRQKIENLLHTLLPLFVCLETSYLDPAALIFWVQNHLRGKIGHSVLCGGRTELDFQV